MSVTARPDEVPLPGGVQDPSQTLLPGRRWRPLPSFPVPPKVPPPWDGPHAASPTHWEPHRAQGQPDGSPQICGRHSPCLQLGNMAPKARESNGSFDLCLPLSCRLSLSEHAQCNVGVCNNTQEARHDLLVGCTLRGAGCPPLQTGCPNMRSPLCVEAGGGGGGLRLACRNPWVRDQCWACREDGWSSPDVGSPE